MVTCCQTYKPQTDATFRHWPAKSPSFLFSGLTSLCTKPEPSVTFSTAVCNSALTKGRGFQQLPRLKDFLLTALVTVIFRPAAAELSAVMATHMRTRANGLSRHMKRRSFLGKCQPCAPRLVSHLLKTFLPPHTAAATHTDKAVPLNSPFENEFTLSESGITIKHPALNRNVGLRVFETRE